VQSPNRLGAGGFNERGEKVVAITLMDVVKERVGEKDSYSVADHTAAGVPMLGGCEVCEAVLASYNIYPSASGYVRCVDCIDDDGFDSVDAFRRGA
jgi:hypothetical protein